MKLIQKFDRFTMSKGIKWGAGKDKWWCSACKSPPSVQSGAR